jgi:general secretion pathway protein F
MAIFEYNALNSKGKNVSGIVEAESLNLAQAKLKQKNLFPVSVEGIDTKSPINKNTKLVSSLNVSFSRISTSDVSIWTRQLAVFISSGIPLAKAVSTLAAQAKLKAFKKILSTVQHSIEEGSSFADALSNHPAVFSLIYINMIRAGESSGTLELVLEQLADILENREYTKNKIQASLAYPALMAVVGFFVLIYLLVKIVPEIITIFQDMDQILPAPTRILITTSEFLKIFWWTLPLMAILFFVSLYFIRRTKKGALFIDKFLINLPFVGSIMKKLIGARFASTLESLLHNGVPILTALDITNSITGNRAVSDLIDKAIIIVEQGGDLGDSLDNSKYFPTLVAQMITIGEQSGELEKMLKKIGTLYEKEVESSITTATALVEPLIILVMGVVLGFIILSICLPIFEINQFIQ